ncbi:hypothetical protein I4U23_001050 [Adineta vaga]|nr:hypothetical protein I4U23_001050 [Adineta vaga]
MIQGIQSAAILTPMPPENANQPRWAFLFNKISVKASARLNYIGLAYMFTALVAIGCEAYLIKSSFKNLSQVYSDIYGIHLFAFGVFVVLLCHQEDVLTSVFILGFYQMISLIRTIVLYSIQVALIIEACNESPLSSCTTTTIKALVITSLICALFAFLLVWENLIVVARECQPQSPYALQLHSVPVAYINQAHVPLAS